MAITNDINNALVNSMYIVANDVVDKTAFDRTLTCFIKSVESAADGIYIVQSDTAQFTAYAADGARYYKNETVYVQVPQGDTSNKKFILGRVSDDEVAETNFQMMMPFDNLIKVHELPNSQVYAANQHGFRANKGREFVAYNDEATGENVYVVESEDFVPDTNITIFEYVRPTDTDTEDDTFMGMTKIGLVMDWQTLLGDYAPVSGTYGITIEIVGTTKSVDDMPEIPNVHYKTQFFSNEMYGNPYAYSYPTEQQKVIDISQFRNIDSITVKFWQDMDFVDGLYNAIPYRENFPPNILISNLHLWVGLAGSEQNEEFVYLFTRGSTRYTPMVQQEGTERDFTLHLNWIHDSTILKSTGDLEAYNVDLGIELGGETAPIHYSPEGKLIGGNSVSRTAYSNRELKTQWYYYDPESHDEISLETYGSEYVGPYWKKIENSQNLFDLNILEFINPELHSQERFCVAVFYDGKKAVSNTITYKNIEDVENQIKEYIANEKVILKIYREEPTEEGSEIVLDTNASAGRFLVYNENNQVLSDTHGRKYSDIQYYVQIFKRQEDGSYAPLAYETDPFTAAWNYDTLEGRRYTMFREFTTIIDEETLMKFDGYLADPTHHEMFSAITRGFKIKDTFDVENQVNDLAAVVSENGKIFYAHKVFSFGQSGTMGSKYTASIVVQSNARAAGPEGYNEANAYIVNRNVFKLDCQVYDKDNQLVETPYKVKWKIVNDVELDWVGETFDWAGLDPNNLPTELVESTDFYYKEDGGNSAYGRINISDSEADNTAIVHTPIVEATISGLPEQDYDLTVRRGLMTVMYNDMVGINAAQYVQTHQIICPDRIEFKSDGSIPYYYNREFEVIELTNKDELYKKTYPVWELINPIANLKLQATAHDLRAVTSEGAVTLDPAYNTYKLVCDTSQDTSLVYWKEEYLQKTPELRIIVNDAVYVYQPIVLAQNQYASSLVNQWDNGTLTLDEENGAMLGRMIAAGTKNNINQFTGIMMGDWSPKADESLNETGLYGYENGQQSFGFKSDGTAFIGKEGAGRIEFDGNTAMIKGRAIGAVDENNKLQTDREFYINLNPRVLNQSTETPYDPKADNSNPNFVFCKIPKMSIVSAAGHSGQFVDDAGELYINNEWAKQYLDDTTHDYFVVDPNNGLVLSGCVFANAGYIGKWLLKDGGLFWRSPVSHSLNDFYKTFYDTLAWENLTKSKIFDIIYFGDKESSPFNKIGITLVDKTDENGNIIRDENGQVVQEEREVTQGVLNHRDYIMSAGLYSPDTTFKINDIYTVDGIIDQNQSSKYLLNYGVTAEGFLYSRYGKIGGWNISNTELRAGEAVVLDSSGRIALGDAIELDGRDLSKIAIRLNPKRKKTEAAQTALIELAQFKIQNRTPQQNYVIPLTGNTEATNIILDDIPGMSAQELEVKETYNAVDLKEQTDRAYPYYLDQDLNENQKGILTYLAASYELLDIIAIAGNIYYIPYLCQKEFNNNPNGVNKYNRLYTQGRILTYDECREAYEYRQNVLTVFTTLYEGQEVSVETLQSEIRVLSILNGLITSGLTDEERELNTLTDQYYNLTGRSLTWNADLINQDGTLKLLNDDNNKESSVTTITYGEMRYSYNKRKLTNFNEDGQNELYEKISAFNNRIDALREYVHNIPQSSSGSLNITFTEVDEQGNEQTIIIPVAVEDYATDIAELDTVILAAEEQYKNTLNSVNSIRTEYYNNHNLINTLEDIIANREQFNYDYSGKTREQLQAEFQEYEESLRNVAYASTMTEDEYKQLQYILFNKSLNDPILGTLQFFLYGWNANNNPKTKDLKYYVAPASSEYIRTYYYDALGSIPSLSTLSNLGDNYTTLHYLTSYNQVFALDNSNTSLDFIRDNDYDMDENSLFVRSQSGLSIICGNLLRTSDTININNTDIIPKVDADGYILHEVDIHRENGDTETKKDIKVVRFASAIPRPETTTTGIYPVNGEYILGQWRYVTSNEDNDETLEYYVLIQKIATEFDKSTGQVTKYDYIIKSLYDGTDYNYKITGKNLNLLNSKQQLHIQERRINSTTNQMEYVELTEKEITDSGLQICLVTQKDGNHNNGQLDFENKKLYVNNLTIQDATHTDGVLAYMMAETTIKDKEPVVILEPLTYVASNVSLDAIAPGSDTLQSTFNGYLHHWNIIDSPKIAGISGSFEELDSRKLYENGKQVATKELVYNLISGIEQQLTLIYNLKGGGGGKRGGGGGGSGVGMNPILIFKIVDSPANGLHRYTFINGYSNTNTIGTTVIKAAQDHAHFFGRVGKTGLHCYTTVIAAGSSLATTKLDVSHQHTITCDDTTKVLKISMEMCNI